MEEKQKSRGLKKARVCNLHCLALTVVRYTVAYSRPTYTPYYNYVHTRYKEDLQCAYANLFNWLA